MKHLTKITISSVSIIIAIVIMPAGTAKALLDDVPDLPAADARSNILIAELKTHSETSTDGDFVELYNPNDIDVDVTGWLLQYRTASALPEKPWIDKSTAGKDQDTKARLICGSGCQLIIPALGRLLIASPLAKLDTANVVPTVNMGFASTGGQVRLVSVDTSTAAQTQEDLVGYGKVSTTGLPSATAEHAPAPAHGSSQSLKRIIDEQNKLFDTDDNFKDFEISDTPTPGLADTYVPAPQESINPTTDIAQENAIFAVIRITEVLPDPISPQTDAEDEFVELYNSGTEAVDIKGFTLLAGATESHAYTFGTETRLEAGAYYVIYSKDSELALTNGGSVVKLESPDGTVLGTTTYGLAVAGNSWALPSSELVAANWQWSATPTPGAANIIVSPLDAAIAKAAAKKAAAQKKAATPKTKATKPPKAAKAKKEPKTKTVFMPEEPETKQDASMWVAGGMAMMTSGYLAYDYRSNLRRFLEYCMPWK